MMMLNFTLFKQRLILTAILAVCSESVLAASASPLPPSPVVIAVQARAVVRGPVSNLVMGYGIYGNTADMTASVNVAYPAQILAVHVVSGQQVKNGTVLLDLRADPSALLGLKQAHSAVDFATGEWQRTLALYQQQLATSSQLESAKKNLDDAKAGLQAQTAMHMTDAVMHVRAPAEATVSQISSAAGDRVAAGAVLMQLTRTAAVGGTPAVIGVDPADMPQLHAGDKVSITSLSAGSQKTMLTGHILALGHSVDVTTQMVNVTARFQPNGAGPDSEGLINGQRFQAKIETRPKTYWQVPRSAVLGTGMSPGNRDGYIFQIDSNQHAHRVDVHIAAENGDTYGVDGSLVAGQPVIFAGNASLTDGATVRQQEAQ